LDPSKNISDINWIIPQILPKNFAHGSCAVFVVFGKISVKQKQHRAQPTVDLDFPLFWTIPKTLYKFLDVR
jgi:hypothetical protein